ncbi:immunoglobulin-like domain-containing protein [Catenisphaera adipataccumulans]|uniref:Cell wall-associated NlpC family hydrolase n=1 Tax=Catenisphaera adipataccumulans TaxID=700500 RepID=A0A7W8FUN2_9FIRM|nr:immunoglobulin-like domain-containing protein [Catenisphaera adipataccumulans]MBB5182288.1 cell wall-associated NlpC family hydrolase [Catenisphaera adipataccumulans]
MNRITKTMFSAAMMMSVTTPVMASETTPNENVYSVAYKDKNDLNNAFKKVYSSEIGNMKYITTSSQGMKYESDAYQITVKGLDLNKEGTQTIKMELENKNTNKISKAGSTVNAKTATVNVKDQTAPTFSGKTTIDTVKGTTVNLEDAVKAEDNKDGKVSVSFSGDVDYNKLGSYQVTATAKDKAGNETSEKITVNVNNDSYYESIAQAALAQVGVNQDCTMLVTNSLKAVGIEFHGWPEDYLSLGDLTTDPVPGDIVVYQGHVAVYIGNGQAVHGGWNGTTTVVSSVECSNTLIGYVHVRKA